MSINIMLVIVLIVLLLKMSDGYKKGMVKEIVSVISMIVLCVVLALLAYGASSYFDGQFAGVAVAVVLLVALWLVHHLINVVLLPAKFLAKLPIVKSVDKLLGILFGAIEVFFVLWTLYALIMMFDLGTIGQTILSYTRESAILTWLYQHNYLAQWLESFMGDFTVSL